MIQVVLRVKSHFENDKTQNYLAFQPIQRYFKMIGNTEHISALKSDERIKPPATSDNSFAPGLSYVGNRIRLKFDGSCLKQDKLTFTHGSITNTLFIR